MNETPKPRRTSWMLKWTAITAIATVIGSLAAWLMWWKPPASPPASAVILYRGRVSDDGTRATLSKAKVSIDAVPTPLTIYTDDEGIFVASLSSEHVDRDVRIIITAAGYDHYERSVIPREGRLEDFRLRRTAAAPTPPPVKLPVKPGNDESPRQPPPVDPGRGGAARSAEASRFVNPNIAALGGRALLIVDQRLGPDHALTARVAKNVGAVDALFRPAFSSDGVFARVHGGDLDPLRTMGIDGVQFVALGVKSARAVSQEVAGSTVFKGTVTISVRVIFPARGFTSDLVSVEETGAGFDDEVAIKNATDKAVDSLIKRLAAM